VQQQNKFCKRIGIQKRNSNGQSEGTTYLTIDTGMATYPVIIALQKNATFIAYLQQKGEKNFISYQHIVLN
jgi:hypothetical protein